MSDELKDLTVLVTRPSHQASRLMALLREHGAQVLGFPTLEIEANTDNDAIIKTIGDINDYDIAIFISINAVSHGVQYLPATGDKPLLAAIGPSTARALVDAGFKTDIKATRGFTSEALLREPALRDVDGKKVIIFRGSGGRALLGRELEQRGASVTYAEVYRRDRPETLDPDIDAKLRAGSINVITATSAETLVNLYELAEEPTVTGLTRAQLVTASERVVKKAAALGFEQEAVLADGPDDESLVAAVIKWRENSDSPVETRNTMTEPNTRDETETTDDITETSAIESVVVEEPEDLSESTDTLVIPEKKKGGGALALFAMLVSLAALAGTAYLWWEARLKEQAIAEAQTQAGSELEETQREIASLSGRLDQNLAGVSGLESGRGRIEGSIDDLRSSIEILTARLQSAEQSIDAVRGISASARNNWIRAEAEYFLQAANSRLQLARDPDAALAALQAADDRLKSLGDPTLFRVRQELAGEINALKAVPRPDMEGIAHTLNGLAAKVEDLPLKNAAPGSYESSAPGEMTEEKPLDKALSTLSGVFSSMISVKRTDEAATPLLSRDEEFFLKRNLELQLQSARLALLRGEPANYQESLRTARNWLQTHFMSDAAAVESAVDTLVDLESRDIAPSLPDVSGSLRLLRMSSPPSDAPAAPIQNNAPANNEAAIEEALTPVSSDDGEAA